jgi:YD repeat-containing protein
VTLKEDGEDALKVHYDANGKLRSRTSGGKSIEYLHNKEGQLVQVNHEGQLATSYTYDACGRMKTAGTSQGVRTIYEWDKQDRKTEERTELPGGMWTLVRWKYTPSGKTKSITAFRNGDDPGHVVQDTSYRYDELGRCIDISVGGRMGIEYKYDAKTLRLKEKAFGNGWLASYAHYPDGWPEWMKVVDAEGRVVKEVRYHWDTMKRLASRTIDGVEQKFEYDKVGRLSAAQPGQQGGVEQ